VSPPRCRHTHAHKHSTRTHTHAHTHTHTHTRTPHMHPTKLTTPYPRTPTSTTRADTLIRLHMPPHSAPPSTNATTTTTAATPLTHPTCILKLPEHLIADDGALHQPSEPRTRPAAGSTTLPTSTMLFPTHDDDPNSSTSTFAPQPRRLDAHLLRSIFSSMHSPVPM
jgi:hypothetical protein